MTETQTASPPPLTILTRVGSIPLVSDSLSAVHSTLSQNRYTSYPYASAQAISRTALGYTAPIQYRLAPVLTRADGIANAGLDAVESRYPYPFKASTDDIVKDLKGTGDAARDAANKTIDQRLRSPAYSVAQGIDQRFTPIVDYMQVYIDKFSPDAPSTSSSAQAASNGQTENQYQYQRAIELSKDLRDNLYIYSDDRLRQLQAQSVLVQRATATAQSITAAAMDTYAGAHAKVTGLSDAMLAELREVKASTSKMPAHLQAGLHSLTTELAGTIQELSGIITARDLNASDKVGRVTTTVQARVQPLLDAMADTLHNLTSKSEAGKKKVGETYNNQRGHAANGAGNVQDAGNAAVVEGRSFADATKAHLEDTPNGHA